ncbi:hypothetical protein F5888DRAFT_1569622, partial [Russula emetica]
CHEDRNDHCLTPHECAKEVLTRINKIFPKLNPLFEDNHGNLSLTPKMKLQNDVARRENEKIPFDPSITSENNVAECFRVGRLSKNPAQRHVTGGPNRRHDKIKIHTDGACFNNDKQNAQCGGVWFSHNDSRNKAIRTPGEHHSNQIGELIATTTAIQAVPHFVPLKIITD